MSILTYSRVRLMQNKKRSRSAVRMIENQERANVA